MDDKSEYTSSDTLNLHKTGLSKRALEEIKNVNTIGKVNALIQMDWLKTNTQPWYLIVDSDLNILVEPFGYVKKDRNLFLSKLNEGLALFKIRDANGALQ